LPEKEYPWLARWGRGKPKATIDIFGRLDTQTQKEILACAEENNLTFSEELTDKNRQIYSILEHIGRLGLVLQYVLNAGLNVAELANEFGMTPAEMKETLQRFGVEKCFRMKRRAVSASFVALAQLLEEMGIEYETGRRVVYTHKNHRYSAFPSFFILHHEILIFLKDTNCIEKTGRQDIGLRGKGFKVLRFLPDEVTEDPTRISFDIEATIQSLKISEEGRKGQVQSYVIAVPKK